MKPVVVTALLASTLAASALTAPALAAPADLPDPAPTNVHVTWKDETFKQVRVTWQETTPQPNTIVLRHKGTTARYLIVRLAADAPDVVDFSALSVRDYAWIGSTDPLEFAVAVGTQTGDTSPATASESFDAFTPDRPELLSASMSGTSTIKPRWAPRQLADTTPNDPLDRNVPVTYMPYYSTTQGGTQIPIGQRGPATELTFTGPKPPFWFGVVAHNEWGGQFDGAWVTARPTQLTVKVPPWAVYGLNTVKVTGTYTPADEKRQVVLQARNSSTSPWYVLASTNFTGGKFSYDLGTGGSRQYRVAIPNTSEYGGSLASFGAYSTPTASTTQLRPLGYFWYVQIYAGWTNPARLQVSPAVNTTATLQRWNGKIWTTVGPVKITNGYGYANIRTASPSRVAYRYYVPASTYGGLRFAAAYTPTFINVVI